MAKWIWTVRTKGSFGLDGPYAEPGFSVSTQGTVPDALTANGVTAGAATVGAPALAQSVFAFTAVALSAGAPTLDAATLEQTHELASAGIATGASTVDVASLGQIHDLVAVGVAAGTVDFTLPAFNQSQTLNTVGVDTGAAEVGTSTITQAHDLNTGGFTTGAAATGTPAVVVDGEDSLSAENADARAPTLGTPTAEQIYVFGSAGFDAAAPALGSPTAEGIEPLTATGADTGAVELATPDLVSVMQFAASELVTGAVEFTDVFFTSVIIEAANLDAPAPVLGAPGITGLEIGNSQFTFHDGLIGKENEAFVRHEPTRAQLNAVLVGTEAYDDSNAFIYPYDHGVDSFPQIAPDTVPELYTLYDDGGVWHRLSFSATAPSGTRWNSYTSQGTFGAGSDATVLPEIIIPMAASPSLSGRAVSRDGKFAYLLNSTDGLLTKYDREGSAVVVSPVSPVADASGVTRIVELTAQRVLVINHVSGATYPTHTFRLLDENLAILESFTEDLASADIADILPNGDYVIYARSSANANFLRRYATGTFTLRWTTESTGLNLGARYTATHDPRSASNDSFIKGNGMNRVAQNGTIVWSAPSIFGNSDSQPFILVDGMLLSDEFRFDPDTGNLLYTIPVVDNWTASFLPRRTGVHGHSIKTGNVRIDNPGLLEIETIDQSINGQFYALRENAADRTTGRELLLLDSSYNIQSTFPVSSGTDDTANLTIIADKAATAWLFDTSVTRFDKTGTTLVQAAWSTTSGSRYYKYNSRGEVVLPDKRWKGNDPDSWHAVPNKTGGGGSFNFEHDGGHYQGWVHQSAKVGGIRLIDRDNYKTLGPELDRSIDVGFGVVNTSGITTVAAVEVIGDTLFIFDTGPNEQNGFWSDGNKVSKVNLLDWTTVVSSLSLPGLGSEIEAGVRDTVQLPDGNLLIVTNVGAHKVSLPDLTPITNFSNTSGRDWTHAEYNPTTNKVVIYSSGNRVAFGPTVYSGLLSEYDVTNNTLAVDAIDLSGSGADNFVIRALAAVDAQSPVGPQADSITTGAVEFTTATFDQTHLLTLDNVTTGAVEFGVANLDVPNFTAPNLDTGVIELSTPALSESNILETSGFDTGVAQVAVPAFDQEHIFAAPALDTPSAEVALADLGVTVVLSADPTDTQPVEFTSVELTSTQDMTAVGLDTGAAELATPTLGQNHSFGAVAVTTGTAAVGEPAIGQTHTLTALAMDTGAVEFTAADFIQIHDLQPVGFATPAVVFDQPTAQSVMVFEAADLDTGAVEFTNSDLGQEHQLQAVSITTGAVIFGPARLNFVEGGFTGHEICSTLFFQEFRSTLYFEENRSTVWDDGTTVIYREDIEGTITDECS